MYVLLQVVMDKFVIDSRVCGSHFSNLLVSNYDQVMKKSCVSAKNGASRKHDSESSFIHIFTGSYIGTTDGKQVSCGLVPPHRHIMLDPHE